MLLTKIAPALYTGAFYFPFTCSWPSAYMIPQGAFSNHLLNKPGLLSQLPGLNLNLITMQRRVVRRINRYGAGRGG